MRAVSDLDGQPVTRNELYQLGIDAANEFIDVNDIEKPVYMTYEEALAGDAAVQDAFDGARCRAIGFLRRVIRQDHRTIGAGTGLYYDGYVFVNVPITALPVQRPTMRSWSWPGYKVDRTAMGVVAHEVGHHVTHVISSSKKPEELAASREAWKQAVKGKRVSGYEPTLEEAGTETLRLFILNPDLLRKGCPKRYDFVASQLGLRPIERLLRKGWRRVLSNDNYCAAVERWIRA